MLDTRILISEIREMVADEDSPDHDLYRELDEYDRNRVDAIRELLQEIGSYAYDGLTLIPEDDFEDYAREYAEDVGAFNDDSSWPYTCIDWEAAANELRTDYTCITFDGEDYLYRI